MIAFAALPVIGPWLLKVGSALMSPLGRVALVGVIGAGLYFAGFQRGKMRAENACQTAALRAEIATLKADIAIARQAEAAAKALAAAIEVAAAADQKIVEEISRAPSNPACRLDDATARRLQSIGGTRR